ncbi:MAG TPA: hypothetical protein VGE74_08780 [Gemmata sp.]
MNESLWRDCAEPTPMLEFSQSLAGDRKLRLFACACCRRIWDLMTTPSSRTAVEIAERFADGLVSEHERYAAFAAAIREANGWANCCGCIDATYSGGVNAAAFAVATAESVENTGDAAVIAEINFPDFMRAPALIAAIDASMGASASVGAWVQANHDGNIGDEYPHAWEQTVLAAGAVRTAALGIPNVTDATDEYELQQRAQAVECEAQCELLRDIFGNPFRATDFLSQWRADTAVALARGTYESRDFGAMPILADALQDAGCDSADILDHCRGHGSHVRGCWVVDLVLGKE